MTICPDDGDIEFIDCSTINIQYDATGKASVSFSVFTTKDGVLSKDYTTVVFANVEFCGVLMSNVKKPVIGGYDESTKKSWYEWQLSIQGVGNAAVGGCPVKS